jgi:hypothetical protein
MILKLNFVLLLAIQEFKGMYVPVLLNITFHISLTMLHVAQHLY